MITFATKIHIKQYKQNTDMRRLLCIGICFLITNVFFYRLSAKDVVFNIVVPSNTANCWIVGNYNNWDLLKANKCTKIDLTHYTISLNDNDWIGGVTLANLNYKYLFNNCDWIFVEKKADGSEAPNHTFREGIPDTVARWNQWVYDSYFRIYATTPKGTNECYIYGDLVSQKVPTSESIKMEKIYLNPDSTVLFTQIFWTGSICFNTATYRFSSGPSLEYDQLNPSESFSTFNSHPIVLAWKSTYTEINTQFANRIQIYCSSSRIIIEGTTKDELVNIYSMSGMKIQSFKSTGEPIQFNAQKNQQYIVNTPRKTTKIQAN